MRLSLTFRLGLLASLAVVILACQSKPKKQELPFQTKEEYESTMIRSHQAFLKKEKARIQQYIDSSGLDFKQSGTGLRYFIYEEGKGDTLKKGNIAVVKYQLRLLEGDTLYETKANEVQEFAVDFDNVERGLHEAVKKMRLGDKAILILPAHLAHGITGDQAAIPTQATLVYDLHLVAKK
ncbi:MAG: FKBP-type peptidyl-prolyl cis-trans isomerase [Vicingaceae bacterium]